MSQYRATLARISRYKAILQNQPLTIAQFAVRAHCDPTTARVYIRLLCEAKEAHLLEWVSEKGKKPIARYAVGPGKDAPQPARKPKHRPKAKPAFVAPTIRNISPLTSIWMGWERQALQENRHAVLSGHDLLLHELRDDDLRHASQPCSDQHQPAGIVVRHEQRMLAVQSGIGGT